MTRYVRCVVVDEPSGSEPPFTHRDRAQPLEVLDRLGGSEVTLASGLACAGTIEPLVPILAELLQGEM
jgi:hypothetical protein